MPQWFGIQSKCLLFVLIVTFEFLDIKFSSFDFTLQAGFQVFGQEVQLWCVFHPNDNCCRFLEIRQSQRQRVHHQHKSVLTLELQQWHQTVALNALFDDHTHVRYAVLSACGTWWIDGVSFDFRWPALDCPVCCSGYADSGWCSLCGGSLFRWSWSQLWMSSEVATIAELLHFFCFNLSL